MGEFPFTLVFRRFVKSHKHFTAGYEIKYVYGAIHLYGVFDTTKLSQTKIEVFDTLDSDLFAKNFLQKSIK